MFCILQALVKADEKGTLTGAFLVVEERLGTLDLRITGSSTVLYMRKSYRWITCLVDKLPVIFMLVVFS